MHKQNLLCWHRSSLRTAVLSSLWLLLLSGTSIGQAIDLTSSFRTVDADAYLRLHFENDVFACTDCYYSNGINLEFVHPKLRHVCLCSLLKLEPTREQFGIAIEQNGYTPTIFTTEEILHGDRPYAATLLLTLFSVGIFESQYWRLFSLLSAGVIGPVAGGYEMQSFIHKVINDVHPLGWQNQIQNDIAINYEAGIEKNLLSKSDILLLNAFGKLRVGTLNIKLSSGLELMIGKLNDRILSGFSRMGTTQRNLFSYYFYWQGMLNCIGYDATLQGGMFNKTSPYTISAKDLSRFTFQTSAGFVLNAMPFYLEYGYTLITPEFENALLHAWGGLRIGVALTRRMPRSMIQKEESLLRGS